MRSCNRGEKGEVVKNINIFERLNLHLSLLIVFFSYIYCYNVEKK